MSLTEMQDRSIDRLLKIPLISKRGSGHLQSRMRAAARKEYVAWAMREGYSEKQALSQWQDIKDMAELERLAEGRE